MNMSFAEQSGNHQENEERSYGSRMMDRLSGSKDGRIDHVLQVCLWAIFPYSCVAIPTNTQYSSKTRTITLLLY